MLNKPLPSDLPIQAFASAAELEAFLDREHATAPGIYVKLAKKSSGIPSISAAEAVEVALCFGWIDGRANTVDENWWLVRYTPRRAKSIWSQKNVNTVARLEAENRIRPAGFSVIEAAKSDGRWERAYAGPATITVPDDFAAALALNAVASSFFEGLNKSERYSVLWRVETASTKARAKRIDTLVETLAAGTVPGTVVKQTGSIKTRAVPKVSVTKRPKTKSEKGQDELSDSESKRPRREGLRRR